MAQLHDQEMRNPSPNKIGLSRQQVENMTNKKESPEKRGYIGACAPWPRFFPFEAFCGFAVEKFTFSVEGLILSCSPINKNVVHRRGLVNRTRMNPDSLGWWD